jgi:hypothetical protein
MLAFLAAAALAAPALGIGPEDYPEAALAQKKSAATLVNVVVDPEGRVVRCATLLTYGDEKLAHAICHLLSGRRQTPAKLRDGTPAWGVSEGLIKLWLPGTEGGEPIGKIPEPVRGEFTVGRLPEGDERARVKLVLAVDAAGVTRDCGAGTRERQKALVAIACKDAERLHRELLKDETGQPVGYVTNMPVDLVARAEI